MIRHARWISKEAQNYSFMCGRYYIIIKMDGTSHNPSDWICQQIVFACFSSSSSANSMLLESFLSNLHKEILRRTYFHVQIYFLCISIRLEIFVITFYAFWRIAISLNCFRMIYKFSGSLQYQQICIFSWLKQNKMLK